ncbi:MAG: Lipoprotein-releasing system transmembrane protein LolE [Chlamydiae bacterium]|nr:Lipoprotein-releasing system transmembrane protein LolE [Chlamydiota bacterium]
MFELSVALKYLIPRWRQLSVSIISVISIIVIALVVWLIVVFFSVTHGLEKNWINKLIALTAPVRVTPTKEYYNSYYYLSDSISANANYTLKSIGEKLASPTANAYDPDFDEEVPGQWQSPDLDAGGNVKDLVKLAFNSLKNLDSIPELEAREYEMTVTNLHLQLLREKAPSEAPEAEQDPMYISQAVYLGSYDAGNPNLPNSMLPATKGDVQNLMAMAPSDSHSLFKEISDQDDSPVWLFDSSMPASLPSEPEIGDAILLPKPFQDSGVLIGDRGYFSYQTPTATSIQEQRVPIFVAGFYDPGIIPFGGKIVLANQHLTSMIRSAYPQEETALSNGINVRFARLDDAELVKEKLQKAFLDAGIDKYWHIETYREFEFTKDLLQQLRSERNLFSLISAVIIIVACSNIISMLIILVNDKKMEIGILRSMGASPQSIATIFGLCGVVMGFLGSLIGVLAALVTLRNLQGLIDLITRLQGFDAFNPVFYGDKLPNEVSFEALVFVMGVTALISLIAGVVPAVKACLLRPSAILRSE